jgi:hypothetical protein
MPFEPVTSKLNGRPHLDKVTLSVVSATASDDVWAAGHSDRLTTTFGYRPSEKALIEHWDGGAWTRMTLPRSADARTTINEIVARSRGEAWGAGGGVPLLRWDGRVWSSVAVPGLGKAEISLLGPEPSGGMWAFTALITTHGTSTGEESNEYPLAFRYDGASWERYDLGAVGPTGLRSIILGQPLALSPKDAWVAATGLSGRGESLLHTPFFFRWDGRSWSVVSAPGFGASYRIDHLIARSRTEIFAFGHTEPGDEAVVLRWDGERWDHATSPEGVPVGAYPRIATGFPGEFWLVSEGSAGWRLIGPCLAPAENR